MNKYHVILLAGGEKGPLFETTGYIEKALIPVCGVPMLSRVIEAFHQAERVEDIVVVGSSNLDSLDAMQHVRKRLTTGFNVVQNLLHAVSYIKYWVNRGGSKHNGYLISFCDAVFLTPEMIDATIETIEAADGDVVLHYVEKESFEEAGLPAKRTYIPIDGKHYTGSAIYYVKRFGKVLAALPKLFELRRHRKDPQKMLEQIGWDGGDLAAAEAAMSHTFGANVRLCVSKFAELGLDVDKPSDLELAEQWLADR